MEIPHYFRASWTEDIHIRQGPKQSSWIQKQFAEFAASQLHKKSFLRVYMLRVCSILTKASYAFDKEWGIQGYPKGYFCYGHTYNEIVQSTLVTDLLAVLLSQMDQSL